MLPGQPPTFRQPSAAERPWWWRFEDASGEAVEVAGHSDQRFANQGDAESWPGADTVLPEVSSRRHHQGRSDALG